MSIGSAESPGQWPLSHRLDRMARELAHLSATGRSADGCATVTVGARGELVDLVLDAGALRRLDASTLAMRILEAARAAGAQARTSARDIVSDHLPATLRPVLGADGAADFGRVFNAGIDQLTSVWSRR
jgi:DNA-binding protein YbaB